MGIRVRLTNERVNDYGTRILTGGLDTAQYERNPVLLHMHQRGMVVGKVINIKKEGDEVTGEIEFDEATELSKTLKKQFEFGSLNMVSVGIDIIETSEDPQYVVPGQTAPTVIKSKLYEVSVVDVGANDDALVLRHKGRLLQLGAGGYNPLPQLKSDTKMERKTLSLLLGLPETADEVAIQAKIARLMKQGEEIKTMTGELEQLKLSAITAAVDGAIKEGKLLQGKKEQFVNLGKQIGLDSLKATLEAMMPAGRVSNIIGGGSSAGMTTYKKLSEVPADELAVIRQNDLQLYKRLYKAEYGVECVIEQ